MTPLANVIASTTGKAIYIMTSSILSGMKTVAASAAIFAQDTSKVAYVARPGGPVDTSTYMWIGYGVVLVVYGSYIALLLRRNAGLRRQSRVS